MSTGEAEDGQWRRHSIRHDLAGFRELCRGIENLSSQVSRSKLIKLSLASHPPFLFSPFHLLLSPSVSLSPLPLVGRLSLGKDEYLNKKIDWFDETQSARGENQNRPGSSYGSGGPVGGGGGSGPSSTGAGPNASSAPAYHGQPEGSNNILSPHGMDPSEHDNGGYGNVYPNVVGVGHNGAVSESY